MKSKSILFDSNVLIYAQNSKSPLYGAAQLAHNLVASKKISACVSLQNLAEFLAVVTSSRRVDNPLTHAQAFREIAKYANSETFSVITPTAQTVGHLQTLSRYWNSSHAQYIYDLQLVATMRSNGVSRILTANKKHFQSIDGLEVIDLQTLSSAF